MIASEKTNETAPLPGVSSLLTQSWQIYKKEPYTFLGFSGWLFVPIILNLLANLVLPAQFDALADTAFSTIAYGVLAVWMTVAITITTRQIVTNKPKDTIIISRLSWQLMISFLLAIILTSLLNLVGFFLLIVPSILFGVWYTFAPTILLLEGGGFIEAFQKSKALVKGRFMPMLWRIFGGNVTIGFTYLAIFLCLIYLYLTVFGLNVETYINSPVSIIDQMITAVVDVIVLPMFVIYSTVFYFEAKRNRASS